jgi:hypothetical protein
MSTSEPGNYKIAALSTSKTYVLTNNYAGTGRQINPAVELSS